MRNLPVQTFAAYTDVSASLLGDQPALDAHVRARLHTQLERILWRSAHAPLGDVTVTVNHEYGAAWQYGLAVILAEQRGVPVRAARLRSWWRRARTIRWSRILGALRTEMAVSRG